ncbi:MAG: kua-ubiquitin conjugating enzyme hybrid localization domain protein [Deltaproteobacteria bacterium]|nr:kua-ubiquitin conjugating enzyme hybrid localization domain protein [Deltaproteobacteria bacterium]
MSATASTPRGSGDSASLRASLARGAQPAPVRRKRWLVALDFFSLSLAAALTALALARIEALPPLAWLPLLALAALFGWAFADFGSGLVHFLCDRFGSERTPLLGPAVIRPFREHHVDPREITTHGFVELSGNNALALTPMLVLGSELAPFFGDTLSLSAVWTWLMSASAGLFTTNQIHRWAHMPRAPRVARLLQRLRLAISAEAHAAHHRAQHDVAYCITNGWCNALLDRARLWPRLERALRREAERA